MSDICEQTPSSNSEVCPTLGLAPFASIHLLKKGKLLQECKQVYEEAKGNKNSFEILKCTQNILNFVFRMTSSKKCSWLENILRV